MIIDERYKPWLAAASDESRPLLCYLNVERLDDTHGVMLGTDGHGAAGIPVLLTKHEEVGLVHKSALMELERQRKRLRKSHPHHDRLNFELRDEWVCSLISEPINRYALKGDEAAKYVDLWPLIPHAPSKFEHIESNHNQFALNPLLLYQLAQAAGVRMSTYTCDPITFFCTMRRVVYVWASDWGDTRPIAPWIVMMPIAGNYLDDPKYQGWIKEQRYRMTLQEKHLLDQY